MKYIIEMSVKSLEAGSAFRERQGIVDKGRQESCGMGANQWWKTLNQRWQNYIITTLFFSKKEHCISHMIHVWYIYLHLVGFFMVFM